MSRQRASTVTGSQRYCSSGVSSAGVSKAHGPPMSTHPTTSHQPQLISAGYGCLDGMFDVDSLLPDNLAFDGPGEIGGGAIGSDF